LREFQAGGRMQRAYDILAFNLPEKGGLVGLI
jgi:hypothetical protein